jgi:hypothetical protein
MGLRAAARRPGMAVAALGLGAAIALAGCAGVPLPSQPAPSQPAPSGSTPASATPGGSPSSAPPPGAIKATTKGLVLGAFSGGQRLAGFDQQVGPAILTVSYVHWGTPVGHLATLVNSAARDHAEAVLEFEPGAYGRNASDIAAGGGSDAWLDQVGHLLVRLRRHVAVSFFPEMNGPWHQGWSAGPASYVQAYRHVHAVLSGLAGWLITWIWQSSAIHKDTPSPMPWWPGAGYVDVAAMDSYYYYPHDSFNAVFGATISQIRPAAPAVPIMIGEVATGPLYNRQVWEINNLFAGIRRDGLIGLIWFNQFQHERPYQFHQDWRLQDNHAALAAFRTCLAQYGPLSTLKA